MLAMLSSNELIVSITNNRMVLRLHLNGRTSPEKQI